MWVIEHTNMCAYHHFNYQIQILAGETKHERTKRKEKTDGQTRQYNSRVGFMQPVPKI